MLGRTVMVVISGGLMLGGLGASSLAGSDTSDAGPSVAFRMELNGFEVVEDGVGTTGRHSSYHGFGLDDDECFEVPSFGEERVRFSGRLIPAAGVEYDEGVIGVRIDGDDLVVAVAAGVGSQKWTRGNGGNIIGQGDLFVTVRQNGDLYQFALLNDLNSGKSLANEGRWRAAQMFRYSDQAEVGHAVLLTSEDHVSTSGGNQGHERGGNSPVGLDERVFARGGEDTGVGKLDHYEFDAQQPLEGREVVTWNVSEWTIPLTVLGDEEEAMTLAFHIAPSCGNDQIGGEVRVPSKEERDAEKKKQEAKKKKRKKEIS